MMVLFLVSAALISNSSSHGNLTTGISYPDFFSLKMIYKQAHGHTSVHIELECLELESFTF